MSDLFATQFNNKLALFVSPAPDHKAWAVDALSLEWKSIIANTFPPFRMILQVLSKVLLQPLASQMLNGNLGRKSIPINVENSAIVVVTGRLIQQMSLYTLLSNASEYALSGNVRPKRKHD